MQWLEPQSGILKYGSPVLIWCLNQFLGVTIRGIKKVNLSQCMLDELERRLPNSKKKSLHIPSSYPVLEWESSVHVPEIQLVQEIHFGIWNRLDIMIISSSVQVYSFSTKQGGAKYHFSFNSSQASASNSMAWISYSLSSSAKPSKDELPCFGNMSLMVGLHEPWKPEICCLFLFVSSSMPSDSDTVQTHIGRTKIIVGQSYQLWVTPPPPIFFSIICSINLKKIFLSRSYFC